MKQNSTKYTWEKTILLAIENTKLNLQIQNIARKNRIQIYNFEHSADIIAVPCFIIVIDKSILNNLENILFLKKCASLSNIDEWQIWYSGESKTELPSIIRRFTVLINDKKDIENMLQNRILRINKKEKISNIKSRVQRIIEIFILLQKHNKINENAFCEKYNIHKRTLQRDIALLRELKISIQYDGSIGDYSL